MTALIYRQAPFQNIHKRLTEFITKPTDTVTHISPLTVSHNLRLCRVREYKSILQLNTSGSEEGNLQSCKRALERLLLRFTVCVWLRQELQLLAIPSGPLEHLPVDDP